jgi:hypothetical protein
MANLISRIMYKPDRIRRAAYTKTQHLINLHPQRIGITDGQIGNGTR